MDWREPSFLALGLAAAGLFAALVGRAARRRRWVLERFTGPELKSRLSGTAREGSWRVVHVLRWAGLVLLALAAAAPRWGREVVRVSGQGSDLVLLFDVSLSMSVTDVPPSRLDEAKREARVLLDGLTGDRVAIVAFAGDAVVLSPLSLDYSAARLLVESLSPGMMSEPGSDLARGLRTALRILERGNPSQQAIVLFTDGEDLERGASGAATVLAQKGLRLFAVGVGTPGGQVVPLADDAGRVVGVKRHADGQAVVSRLDERLLRDLARRTGGAYFAATHPGGEVTRLRRAVSRVERGRREGRLGTRPVERYWLLALAAWVCLLAAWLMPRRRRATALAAARSSLAAGLLWLVLAGVARAGPLEDGNAAYRAGRLREAVAHFRAGVEARPDDWRLQANLGSALYRLGEFAASEEALRRALASRSRRTAAEEAAVRYNLGNALFRQERYAEAAESYRTSLEKQPDDPDARFNYEAALARLRGDDEPPPPRAGGSGGGAGGSGAGGGAISPPPPSPAGGSLQPRPAETAPTPEPRAGGRLTRSQAERLLDALAQEEGDVQKRRARSRVQVERRERDW
jgi:Ca-activated chloride channel family protein